MEHLLLLLTHLAISVNTTHHASVGPKHFLEVWALLGAGHSDLVVHKDAATAAVVHFISSI